jgi:tetratricopeptide (TPR) repeat protein
MQTDRHGIPVSSENAAAVARLDRAVFGLLAHRADTGEHLAAARAADPGMALGHALAGFCHLLLGRGELVTAAVRALELARDAMTERGATPRESGLVAALALWCSGDMETAADGLDRVFAVLPHDAMTGKLVHAIRFMLGDVVGMRRSVESALPAWSPAMPDYGFLLGWRAFALEELGELALAERLGREAVEHRPEDAWGCHAVAHVLHMRHDLAGGLAWLGRHATGWSDLNNFARHLHWHRALMLLSAGEIDAVLELYDSRIRDQRSDDYRDVTNACSLLRRLERDGVQVGDRWEELADLAIARMGDHALAFAGLHHLFSLIGAGRLAAARQRVTVMECAARRGRGTQARLFAEVAVPLARSALSLAEGRIPVPPSRLRESLARLGGSRVQRQTFEAVLDEADRAALSTRLAARGGLEIRGAA